MGALANFFQGLLSSKAHRYRVVAAKSNESNCDLIRSTFPSLLYLSSLEDEIFNQVLVELGLGITFDWVHGCLLLFGESLCKKVHMMFQSFTLHQRKKAAVLYT